MVACDPPVPTIKCNPSLNPLMSIGGCAQAVARSDLSRSMMLACEPIGYGAHVCGAPLTALCSSNLPVARWGGTPTTAASRLTQNCSNVYAVSILPSVWFPTEPANRKKVFYV